MGRENGRSALSFSIFQRIILNQGRPSLVILLKMPALIWTSVFRLGKLRAFSFDSTKPFR